MSRRRAGAGAAAPGRRRPDARRPGGAAGGGSWSGRGCRSTSPPPWSTRRGSRRRARPANAPRRPRRPGRRAPGPAPGRPSRRGCPGRGRRRTREIPRPSQAEPAIATTAAMATRKATRCRTSQLIGHRPGRRRARAGPRCVVATGRTVAVVGGVEDVGAPADALALVGVRRGEGGRDLVGGGAGLVSQPAALDLAHGQRPEGLHHRVVVPTLGQRSLGQAAELARRRPVRR